ncbi:MAG: pyridoxamine 5'-phosphate oxidase family protein, partial [Rhodocyclaceae bacterium]|nr:pyridoxamine 5'-phosphate oxidase family protein [Rhodocyclaceae bacterium]
MDAESLASMRKDYQRAELSRGSAAPDPLDQFRRWFDEAVATVPEANAMTLATVDEDGRPSSRPVLLKSFDANGLVWFSNYHSRK